MTARSETGGESAAVIVKAFAANLGIAIAKFAAAALTGSSAMLIEGVHSLVDTANQVLLFYGQRQSRRPADALHPGGYAREQYFWTFVVAELVFTLGAGIAVMEGIDHLRHPSETQSPFIALTVLAIAFLLEAWSLNAALQAFRQQNRGTPFFQAIKRSTDTTTLSVLLEDSAAVIGLSIAAAGILLELATGNPMWDAAASIAIGIALGLVAVLLLAKSKHLLIGQAADPAIGLAVRRLVRGSEHKGRIVDVLTIQDGIDRVICVVTIDFEDGLAMEEVERLCTRLETIVRQELPVVSRFYISPYYPNPALAQTGS
ncbi:MAG: cation diffusion facilitator family transporter [Novosphingobium sp.]